ncbi:MAG: thiol peroxidase [Anaerolineae bacterium]|nr:thiol peroxidase [Anaerolineae bacterium]
MITQTSPNVAQQLGSIKIISESSIRATFRGVPQSVLGRRLAIGELFPAVTLVSPDLASVDLSQFCGQVRLISVIPSIDTGICDAQTRRFSAEATRFGDRARVITISTDLPFTQKRWLHDAQIDNMTMLSDHREMAFGYAVGVYVQEMRILQRSIFVVDRDDRIAYCEYVREIGQHPDYDAALSALEKVASSQ